MKTIFFFLVLRMVLKNLIKAVKIRPISIFNMPSNLSTTGIDTPIGVRFTVCDIMTTRRDVYGRVCILPCFLGHKSQRLPLVTCYTAANYFSMSNDG